ncbi:hypothetical protein J4446_01790 [Candidatus Woesearchaeota archaeon]|nr:hypothetical protein [Candidatus Woesearchaeota archaeon]
MKNKVIISLIFFVFSFLIINAVNATVGVTSFYYDKNPLMVEAGEIKEVAFMLQNHGGDADAIVMVELADGGNIAEFTDENLEYFVELDSSDISVPMKITIPEDAQPGDEWNVGASFSISYKPRAGGALQLSSTYFKDFKVIVKQPDTTSTQATKTNFIGSSPIASFIVLVIILIILVLLIKFISKRKK